MQRIQKESQRSAGCSARAGSGRATIAVARARAPPVAKAGTGARKTRKRGDEKKENAKKKKKHFRESHTHNSSRAESASVHLWSSLRATRDLSIRMMARDESVMRRGSPEAAAAATFAHIRSGGRIRSAIHKLIELAYTERPHSSRLALSGFTADRRRLAHIVGVSILPGWHSTARTC